MELQAALNSISDDLAVSNLLMSSIKKARSELNQTHIDFYRPVSHKEVLDETYDEVKAKLQRTRKER